jgi:hypothetical protein
VEKKVRVSQCILAGRGSGEKGLMGRKGGSREEAAMSTATSASPRVRDTFPITEMGIQYFEDSNNNRLLLKERIAP